MTELAALFGTCIGVGMCTRFVVEGFASAFWQLDELWGSI